MKNSVGLVELKSITKGIYIADEMIKGSGVELLQATSLCPGKYVVIIGGELSAIQNAVDIANRIASEYIIDSFVIGNVSMQVFPALTATTEVSDRQALGLIETFTAASAVEAADLAAKAAVVQLIEIRLARGMGGKCFVMMTGSVASVQAACEAGAKRAVDQGLLVNMEVIANPHEDLWEKIM